MPLPHPSRRVVPLGERVILARIRLEAATQEDLEVACKALEALLGEDVDLLRKRRPGRKGDWLAYGMMWIDDAPPVTPERTP